MKHLEDILKDYDENTELSRSEFSTLIADAYKATYEKALQDVIILWRVYCSGDKKTDFEEILIDYKNKVMEEDK